MLRGELPSALACFVAPHDLADRTGAEASLDPVHLECGRFRRWLEFAFDGRDLADPIRGQRDP